MVYGRGKAIAPLEQACYGLKEIEDQAAADGIVYFGDLDPEGIDIPNTINEHRHKMEMAPVTAAHPLYRGLLEKDIATSCSLGQAKKHDKKLAIK